MQTSCESNRKDLHEYIFDEVKGNKVQIYLYTQIA